MKIERTKQRLIGGACKKGIYPSEEQSDEPYPSRIAVIPQGIGKAKPTVRAEGQIRKLITITN